MSDYNKETKEFLENFLTNDKNNICVFKGTWGIGKTYFWRVFFEGNTNNKLDKKLIISEEVKKKLNSTHSNYSYVSLFGVTSLAELKSKVFNNSLPLSNPSSIWNGSINLTKIIICIIIGIFMYSFFGISLRINLALGACIFLIAFWSDTLINRQFWTSLTWKKTYENISSKDFWSLKYAGKFLNDVNKLGVAKRYLGDATSFIESTYIKNMLVCFDDIERMDLKLPIATLMGYVDELAQQKNCKIILIFNEDQLGRQKIEFDKYREKIVDVELRYNPDLNELLRFVFGNQLKEYPIIQEVINSKASQGFFIKNIRVLQKIKNIINDFESLNQTPIPMLIINDFIKHTVFLSHCYYELNTSDKIPFILIKNNELGIESIKGVGIKNNDDKKEEKDTYNKNCYSELVNIKKSLNIFPSQFSEAIINRLEYGYWDNQDLNTIIQDWVDNIKWKEENKRVIALTNPAWNLYHNSMEDHIDEISSIFHQVISDNENYQYLDIIDFLTLLNYALRFGNIQRQAKPREYYTYINEYISSNPVLISKYEEDRFHIIAALLARRVNKELRNFFKRRARNLTNKQSSNYSIEGIATKLLDREKQLTPREVQFLKSATASDFYNWIMSKDNDPDLYYKIEHTLNSYLLQPAEPMKEALIRISKTSKLNEDRTSKFLQ